MRLDKNIVTIASTLALVFAIGLNAADAQSKRPAAKTKGGDLEFTNLKIVSSATPYTIAGFTGTTSACQVTNGSFTELNQYGTIECTNLSVSTLKPFTVSTSAGGTCDIKVAKNGQISEGSNCNIRLSINGSGASGSNAGSWTINLP